MTGSATILGVVPARGGSRGVPRKNMQPVGGRPLIAHTVDAVRSSDLGIRLIVTSDDDEILGWAELHGCETHRRPAELAADQVTVSEVAASVADDLDWTGVVGVFQPTSPLRSPATIVRCFAEFQAHEADSVATALREPHLFWLDRNGDLGAAEPLFDERVNRQYASHPVLRETGSVQLVRADVLRGQRTLVGQHHVLVETPEDEAIDIDTVDDLTAVRRRFERGTIVFRLRANTEVGSGHLFHCLQLAEALPEHRTVFLLVECDPFAYDILKSRGHEVVEEVDLRGDLDRLAGDGANLVVNDVLDTSEAEILEERAAGFSVLTIEDLGPGARYADWVVNALYPLQDGQAAHVSTGARYATLRSEFLDLPAKEVRATPTSVLVTFGGTDPSDLGPRFARALDDALDVEVEVIVGPGAPEAAYPDSVHVTRHVPSMAAAMLDADIIVTSAGRTVYEAAATGTPVVVVAQNAREATHTHLGYESGVVFLGIGPLVEDHDVVHTVQRLLDDRALRAELSGRLRASVDLLGTERIAQGIHNLLRGL